MPWYLKYLLKAKDKLYPKTGVSDAESIEREWACDQGDADADDLLDQLGLDPNRLSESELRDFLSRYVRRHRELSDLYSANALIPLAQSRAFPPEGWAGNAPRLIPQSADY